MKLIKIGLGRGVPAIGAILFSLYVASKLPASEADVFFIWFTVVYVLSFFGKLGFDTYALRDLGTNVLSSAAECKRTAFVVSTVLALGGLLWAPQEVWWLLFSLPAFSVASINSSVLRAEQKESLGGFLEVSLLSSVAFGILFIQGLQDWVVTLELVSQSFAGGAVVVLLLGEFLVGKNHSLIGGGGFFSSLVPVGLRFVPSPLMIYLTQWIAVFFLSTASTGAVSIYSVAVRLASGFAFIAITIDAFVAPRFARYFREGDKASITALIESVRKKSFLFLGATFIVYALIGHYCIAIFIGVEYVESFYVSLVVAISYCSILFVGPYQYLLLMGGGEKKVSLCNGVALLFVSLGSLLLWGLAIDEVWAYAGLVAFGRLVAILLMKYFSRKIKFGV